MSNGNYLLNSRNLFSFLQRQEAWLEVSAYHVGHVQSEDKPVAIISGSTVVGNIIAPKVVISGLLCGSIVAREVEIQADGQVWGDIHAINFQILSGGNVQGWLSSINEDQYQSIMQNGRLPVNDGALDPELFLDENVEKNLLNRNDLQISTLHQLQTEIAAALAARSELEHSFDRRIDEVAGDSTGKITTLSSQLETTRNELNTLQQSLQGSQEKLQQKEGQVDRQRKELSVAHEHAGEQKKQLDHIQTEYQHLNAAHTDLKNEKKRIDQQLVKSQAHVEKLTIRLQNVEEAMKDSLQHSSELQESLERWQELAEVNDNKTQEFEKQLKATQFQLEENSKLIEILQEQKKQAEEEWNQALSKAGNLHQAPTEADEFVVASILEDALGRMAQLEDTLLDLTEERSQQLLWYRVNLEAHLQAMDAQEQRIHSNEATIAQLQTSLRQEEEKRQQFEAEMQQQQQQYAVLQNEQSAVDTLLSERDTLHSQLREKEHQFEAAESDLQYHLSAIEQQGQHLAEIQSRLVERELQLKQAYNIIKKQQAALLQMRQKAEKHIQQLQLKIAKQN